MSFTKYLESKAQPQILTVMDDYKEKLSADMSSLLMKPTDQMDEARKNIINIREVTRTLSELAYPLAEEFRMAVRTGDPKKVGHAHMTFRRWAKYSEANRVLADKIETAMFQYQTKLYGKEFGADDADEVIKSSLGESQAVLDRMSHSIDLAISKIPTWHNHRVIIEAIYPEKGWIINEARVTVGEAFLASFVYEITSSGLKVKSVSEEEMPATLQVDMQALLNKLRSNPKYNRILTLYMTRPLSERRYFEIAKRDLALGIKAVLPNHVTLATVPLSGDSDVWKVRVEEKYLHEYLQEGDVKQYHIVGEEAPVRWIERMSNEK